MREVVLQIPTLESEQNIEIEVKINGKKRILKYRVEIVNWETTETTVEDRVSVLRRVIRHNQGDWELVQIGAPSKDHIPIMFKKRVGDRKVG
jgi:regulation of enolase protein 1 (concanavalin A-like superfamily)